MAELEGHRRFDLLIGFAAGGHGTTMPSAYPSGANVHGPAAPATFRAFNSTSLIGTSSSTQ